MKDRKKIICYNDEWYDVSGFDHPGDGIKDLYLSNYFGKKVDNELHEYHDTNDPYEMLEDAKKNPFQDCDGIIYLGKEKPLD
jgi:hypothetical protein